MAESSLENDLLRAIRGAPGSTADALAAAVGLPRTNFGRSLRNRLREPVERLVSQGLVEERRGRYRLTDKGRRTLADRMLELD